MAVVKDHEKKSIGRPWKPGESGNPQGRPKGSGDVSKIRESIRQHIPAIIDRLVADALNGDSQAAKLLLDRVLAPLKPEARQTQIDLQPGGNVADLARQVIFGAASGQLDTTEAGQLIGAIAGLAKIIEITEIEKRLAALEVKNGDD